MCLVRLTPLAVTMRLRGSVPETTRNGTGGNRDSREVLSLPLSSAECMKNLRDFAWYTLRNSQSVTEVAQASRAIANQSLKAKG